MAYRIMVIEDDQDILNIVSYVLTTDGYEVLPIIQRPDIGIVEEMQPDLILLDEWLEHQKGSEFCRLLKANTKTSAIPVLIVSALFLIEDIVKEAGADGYIRKPFDIDTLGTTIAGYLKK